MAKRIDQGEFSFDANELPEYKTKSVFSGIVKASRKEAEIEALNLRLQGRVAHVQNGLQGNYEIVVSERDNEVRSLTADYKEIGTGLWQAANPSWDSGSIWEMYAVADDGSVLISRVDDEDVSKLASNLMVASSVGKLTRKASLIYTAGDKIAYQDTRNNFVEGIVAEVDDQAGGYWVRNALSLEMDFIPKTASEEMDHMQDDEFDIVASSDDEDEDADYDLLFDDGEGSDAWEPLEASFDNDMDHEQDGEFDIVASAGDEEFDETVEADNIPLGEDVGSFHESDEDEMMEELEELKAFEDLDDIFDEHLDVLVDDHINRLLEDNEIDA